MECDQTKLQEHALSRALGQDILHFMLSNMPSTVGDFTQNFFIGGKSVPCAVVKSQQVFYGQGGVVVVGGFSPKEVVQGAGAGSGRLIDQVVSSVPAHRVLPQTQEALLVTEHASVVRVAVVIRVCQPLYVVIVCA